MWKTSEKIEGALPEGSLCATLSSDDWQNQTLISYKLEQFQFIFFLYDTAILKLIGIQ